MEYAWLGVAKHLKQIKMKNLNQKFNGNLYLNVHAVPKSETDSSNNQSFFLFSVLSKSWKTQKYSENFSVNSPSLKSFPSCKLLIFSASNY